jgi:molecular chaperone Hsp33
VADTLARTVSDDGSVRAIAAVTTDLVGEAQRRHGTLPTATAALGRTLTGALLLASTIKRDERLSLELSGDGPLRGVLADATPDGDARGFVYRPQTHVPPRAGKLDVGGALGRGVLCVMRVPLAGGSLYRSVVPLVTGEIGEDLASYLVTSEQTASAVGVGVFVDAAGRVVAAGGWLVQALPGADPAALDRIAARVETLQPPSDMVRCGMRPADILAALLDDRQPPLDERPVRFHCRCSPQRALGAIAAMGRDELRDVLAGDRRAEVVCEFCAERYDVGEADIASLLEQAGG